MESPKEDDAEQTRFQQFVKRIGDDEIEEYARKAYGRTMGIELSTLKTYTNKLKLVKKYSGCESLKDFRITNMKLAEERWERLIITMKSEKSYTKSSADLIISALSSYCNIMGIKTPVFVKHQKKGTYAMTTKQQDRKENKEEILELLRKEFPKIYKANLSSYSEDEFLRELARFACIHFFFCGKRMSEVRAALISDTVEIKYEGKIYKAILVRARKTKDKYPRIIKEKRYWECRAKYLQLLKEKGLFDRPKGSDFLFPVKDGGRPISSSRVGQIISGYYTMYGRKAGSVWKPGVCELVWGQRMWTHIFRTLRTNDLLDVMPVEAVMQWRNDSSIDTTMVYVSEGQTSRRMIESLVKKKEDDWT